MCVSFYISLMWYLLLLPVGFGARLYYVNQVNKTMWAKPLLLEVKGDTATWDLAPIHPDWRRWYIQGLSAYSSVSYEGTVLRVHGLSKTSSIEINQHHYWPEPMGISP